tara:strand:- start:96 stop:362 length:267 start_codon:yes stop_codon:yes gene_type:complete
MPKYNYRCNRCDHTFEIIHSIKEKKSDCKECGHADSLERIPFIPLTVNKKSSNDKGEKPGKLTKQFIKEAAEELKEEKEKLKKETYKP